MKQKFKKIDQWNSKELSTELFNNRYLKRNKPVVIKNIFDDYPKLSEWTLDFLEQKLVDKVVKVYVSADGHFGLDKKKDGSIGEAQYLKFSDFCKLLKNNGMHYYLPQTSILHELPELTDYIEVPKYLSKKTVFPNIWVGEANNITPLHFDLANNLYMQVFGTKKIILFSPYDFFYLYANSWKTKVAHTSRINALQMDYQNFIKSRKSKPYEIILNPGDMLFMPAFWWHCVISLSITISINNWFEPLFYQKMVPGFFHMNLSKYYNKLFP